MPIECVWRGRKRSRFFWEPGAMFFRKWPRGWLSPHYLANVAQHRSPIIVMIPARWDPQHGTPFCIDSHPSDNAADGWALDVDMASLIKGERPHITVSPSINAHGCYHGFLQDGVLTDDLGG